MGRNSKCKLAAHGVVEKSSKLQYAAVLKKHRRGSIMGIWDHRGLGRIFISLIFIVAGATQINEWEEMRKVVW